VLDSLNSVKLSAHQFKQRQIKCSQVWTVHQIKSSLTGTV
jgi:hypothetical protein